MDRYSVLKLLMCHPPLLELPTIFFLTKDQDHLLRKPLGIMFREIGSKMFYFSFQAEITLWSVKIA